MFPLNERPARRVKPYCGGILYILLHNINKSNFSTVKFNLRPDNFMFLDLHSPQELCKCVLRNKISRKLQVADKEVVAVRKATS